MDSHRRRHNVSDACFTCRKSKVKCDDVLPCSRCIKNNRADSCVSWRRFKSICLVYFCRFVSGCLSLFLILIAFPPVSVSTSASPSIARVSASPSIARSLSRSYSSAQSLSNAITPEDEGAGHGPASSSSSSTMPSSPNPKKRSRIVATKSEAGNNFKRESGDHLSRGMGAVAGMHRPFPMFPAGFPASHWPCPLVGIPAVQGSSRSDNRFL